MRGFITSRDDWLKEYNKDRRSIWVTVSLSNGKKLWFKDYKKWMKLKDNLSKSDLSIVGLSIQFKSHVENVDIEGAEGVYLVRSLIGQMGGDTKYYYTTGRVVGNTVHKSMWLTPEIIEERTTEEQIEDCFEEAIIYNHDERKKRKEQV